MAAPALLLTIRASGWGAADRAIGNSKRAYNSELRKRFRKALKLLAKETRNQIRSGTITRSGRLLRRGVKTRTFRNAKARGNSVLYRGIVFFSRGGFYGRFLEVGFQHRSGAVVPGRLFMEHAVSRKGKEAERIIGGSIKAVVL